MLNGYTFETERLIDAHKRELTQQAARYRLLLEAKGARRPALCRLRVRLGDLLIVVGRKLQEPYALSIAQDAKAVR